MPQTKQEIATVLQPLPQDHIGQRVEERSVELFILHFKEDLGEVLQLVPQERFQELVVEQVVVFLALSVK